MSTPATTSTKCDALISNHALLTHPFYTAWSHGTLPVPALAQYAREYGAFISLVSEGWDAIGEADIATEEEGHTFLWDRTFAASLGTEISKPKVKQVQDLVSLSKELFSDPVTAVGALYAFEAQQPLTAQSKLKGLVDHYSQLPEECGTYFEIHQDDLAEPALLASKLDALSDADAVVAVAACEKMSVALYDALTGVHAEC